MLLNKPMSIGKLSGTIYDFEEVGDELPLHFHNETDAHISIVARGKLKVFTAESHEAQHSWEGEISTGAVLDWEAGQWHGFTALEPNTRLINIIKV